MIGSCGRHSEGHRTEEKQTQEVKARDKADQESRGSIDYVLLCMGYELRAFVVRYWQKE